MTFDRDSFWCSSNVTGKWVPGQWVSNKERTISNLGGSPHIWTTAVLVIWPMQWWSKHCR